MHSALVMYLMSFAASSGFSQNLLMARESTEKLVAAPAGPSSAKMHSQLMPASVKLPPVR